MGILRDFASILDFFSDREIEDLQAAIDVRRCAKAVRPDDLPAEPTPPIESGSCARGTVDRRGKV